MKKFWYGCFSLLIFIAGYLIIAVTILGILFVTHTPTDSTNPILKLISYATFATWAVVIAPFSLLFTYPLAFKLGRFLMAKKGWGLENLHTILTIVLILYTTPSILLVLLYLIA